MADIFLSYNEKDRPRVRQLAQALERAGWSVWWDRRVPAGLTWRSLLEQELQNMRCMLVLWSSNSVKSEWVCEEATEGRLLGRLIPVFLEKVRPPAGFREVQAADLVDWDGSHDTIGLQQLLDDIAHKLGTPKVVPQDPPPLITVEATPPPQPIPTPWQPWKHWGLMAALLLVAVGIYLGVGAVKQREAVEPTAAPPAASTPSAAVIADPPTFGMPTTIPDLAPVVPPPVVTATAPPAKPPAATPKRTPPARCSAIRERQGMGEMPSAADQAFLNKEC